MAQYFDNDEAGYLRWVEEHRDDGFIANVGGGSPPKLHRANRGCVTTPKRSNYTTTYKKWCSTDQGELEAKKYDPPLTRCKTCFPEERGA